VSSRSTRPPNGNLRDLWDGATSATLCALADVIVVVAAAGCPRCRETDPPIDYVEASAKEAINVDQAFHTLAQKALAKGKHTAIRCVPLLLPLTRAQGGLTLTLVCPVGERTWTTSSPVRISSWTCTSRHRPAVPASAPIPLLYSFSRLFPLFFLLLLTM
jgi:hypothetical protein